MKSLIRSLLAMLYGLGALSYSGRERTWYACGYCYPVSIATFYYLVRRVYGEGVFASHYYIMNRRGRAMLTRKGRLARQRRTPAEGMITPKHRDAVAAYGGGSSSFYLAGPFI